MLSFTKSTFSVSPEICSSTGVTARQGPHHGAQKSATTGFPACSTSSSKESSLTSRIASTLQTASERTQTDERDLPHCLHHDRTAHLGVPLLAVDERDRHLHHAEARAQHAV